MQYVLSVTFIRTYSIVTAYNSIEFRKLNVFPSSGEVNTFDLKTEHTNHTKVSEVGSLRNVV